VTTPTYFAKETTSVASDVQNRKFRLPQLVAPKSDEGGKKHRRCKKWSEATDELS
jgi:hypothetical protein